MFPTLLETSLVLLIGMILTIGRMFQSVTDAETLITKGQAQYQVALQNGYNVYVTDYTGNISALTAGQSVNLAGRNGNPYTVANGLSPTVADLVALGALSQGFGATSPMKFGYTATLTPVNCPGVNCLIQGMMQANSPYKDARGRIRYDMVGDVVSDAGNDAGANYASDPTTIIGFGASWHQPTTASAGTLFMRVGANSTLGNTLFQFYRRDGLWPLTAALNGGGQNINSVVNVNATGTLNGSQLDVSSGTLQSTTGNFQLVNSSGAAANITTVNNITASGNISAAGWLKAGAVGTPEVACSPYGVAAFNADGSGQMLTCRGVWVPTGGRWELVGEYAVQNGWGVPAPSCSAGGLGKMLLNAQTFAVDTTAAVNFGPASGSGPWTVTITDGQGNGIAGSGMATTFCYY
jgi:hypothetical protein